MPWTDDVPEPERDLDELRDVVARKAGRLRNRRRLGLVSGAAALVAVLLVLASLPGGDPKPRRLQAADRPDDTSTTIDPSADGTIDPAEVYGEEPTTTIPGQTPGTTAKRRVASASPTTTTPIPPCGAPSDKLAPNETGAAIVGSWMLCRGSQPLFRSDEAAGIEIRADGRWAKVRRDSTGGMQRTSGWDDSGTWRVVQAQQVDFNIDGQGTVPAHASFTADRSTVKLDSMNGSAVYVRVAAGTRIADPAASGPDTPECARDEGPARQFASASEFVAAVTHVWLVCDGRSFFNTDAAGLEIRSNGRWAELDRRGDGALVRATGTRSGTWELVDGSAMNGPNSYQLNLTMDGSGTHITHPVFATATTKMRLSAMGDHLADHIHAPAGTQVVDG